MLFALCKAGGATVYRPVRGGVIPCKHVQVHDCGRALPEHPSEVQPDRMRPTTPPPPPSQKWCIPPPYPLTRYDC